MVKFSKILFRKFSPLHRSTLLSSNVKIVRRKIGESTRYLPDKKISAASQTVATARIAPKICKVQPPIFGSYCSRFYPNRFTFGGVVAERVKAVFCPIEYLHESPRIHLRRIIKLKLKHDTMQSALLFDAPDRLVSVVQQTETDRDLKVSKVLIINDEASTPL